MVAGRRTMRALAAALVGCLSSAILLGGCAGAGSPATASSPADPSSPSSSPSPTPVDAADLTALTREVPTSMQIVVSAQGSNLITAGSIRTPTAWSTLKVPIAIAALSRGTADTDDVKEAITVSDNDAAIRLWNSLGAGERAADTVQAVLSAHGDKDTTVLPDRVDPDEPFGMTRWQADDQARFMEWLACTDDSSARTVRSYMGQIDSSQQFGLSSIHPSMVKAGWGDEDSGQYTVRQMAVLPHDDGYSVVTFIAQGDSESSVDRTVDAVGTWISAHSSQLPLRHC
ncbi:serine hydrolase [Acidipropionibacterium virtanenii]|uniref:Beta-lactamase class A catalytic domain-containing protein n=1 Tax=Acidipropionibacterium virtanenii TaxID=2057246 RepID=A0A344UVL7_9ACTN|nr:hypothetical protein [Acidipropionibacterium virtanenii]AXE39315.1 hypothetical protein JS278_02163 [Acidipropionibacterium virtanenii]